ncbi:PAS domain S-box protein [Massilia sp. YIM B02763]|uniref:hybrid sensor histidine kinase/response regulator n=1 Tax=Massilia sp. YIM B02763 TaxID=3050130 RepID=UPI0025B6DB5C|nr:PAS domain-containing sensor histidine kinase [Massilia sp. YIM B02763]MDN4055471.1 PAS domain S-box protein [Massilia sp. YIM B02763]
MNDLSQQPWANERRYQYLISGISDYAIYMLDPDGLVCSWNAGAQRFKGYLAPEILGQHFSRFYTPEDRAVDLPAKALGRALEEGKYEAEGWRVRKDGSRFWAHVVIDPIYDEHHVLQGFAKVTRDVTERKRTEDALRESEQRFRLLVQGVTDYAIYMLSPQGTVTNWNQGAERIKGYAQHEIVGQHFSRFYTDVDREGGLPQRALSTAAETGRFEAEGWRMRKDGSRFWAHVVIDAIRGDDGELLGFAKITRDLTEKKKADEALAAADAALYQAQKMESIGQLTGGIAHDFNNLLSVLSSGLEVLALRGDSDVRTVESMRRAVDRGARLTQQLLAFARRQPLQAETRNLNRIIGSFEPVLRRAVNASIDFTIELDRKAASAVIDSALFESALLNLVVNARDAMPQGGKLTIATSNVTLGPGDAGALAPGDYVRVCVADTGSGMAPDIAARAFEPFFTTKEVGKGTGLGLSQVYGFIRQSGGDVVIDTRVGEGTTISIYLPAVANAVADAAHEAAEDHTERVLIVEDEPDLMDVAASLFASMGYDVLTAASGQEAIDLMERRDVDILFTDVVMPNGMNGIELASYTREHYPGTKIMLASGYPLPALKQRHGRELSEFAFVNKPYRLSDLARTLRTTM